MPCDTYLRPLLAELWRPSCSSGSMPQSAGKLMLRTVISFSRLPRLSERRGLSSEHGSRPDPRASSQLWADALEEEETTNSAKPPTSTQQHPNWTGDESVQDAVLRMLVDKYKPLREGAIRTAEEKLKSLPPSVSLESPTSSPENTITHKPWLTSFRAPSHATSIRYMRIPPPLPAKPTTQGPPIHPDDSRSRIIEREKKKAAYAGRLTNARESSLDYRIGRVATAPGDPRMHHPNPVSVKGWRSLVEERIEASVLWFTILTQPRASHAEGTQ